MRWDFKNKKIKVGGSDQAAYKNPLFSKQKWQNVIIENLNFFCWLTLAVIIAICYALFYSPLFQIKKIVITGADAPIAKQIDEQFVRWQLNQRKWLIFKQRNLILFNKRWLQKNIENKYSFNNIKIEKQFPSTISIGIIEKIPTLIWKTNESNFLLDENGTIAQQISLTESTTQLPVIIDGSNSPAAPGKEVLSQKKTQFIINLIHEITTRNTVEVTSYATPHPLSNEVDVLTAVGYTILFDSISDLDLQLTRLSRVLNESTSGISPTEYIDLRFGERVIVK